MGKEKQKDKPVLQIELEKGEDEKRAMARTAASPTANATVTIAHVQSMLGFRPDLSSLCKELEKHALDVRGNDLRRPEATLLAQSHTLDALFNVLSQKAAANLQAGYLSAGDTYLRLALKAQGQCRTTIEAISEIKNPRTATFVKQQNIAGQQQVNNGVTANSATSTHAHARTEKAIDPTNELLEAQHGERLDFGAQGAAGGANQTVEAVGEINRSQDGQRKAA